MSEIGGVRGFRASSIGVTCAAALALPAVALTMPSAAAPPGVPPPPAAPVTAPHLPHPGTRPRPGPRTGPAPRRPGALLPRRRRLGQPRNRTARPGPGPQAVGRHRRPDGPAGRRHAQRRPRRRPGHGADPGTARTHSGRVHGCTAPLWAGDSDGVDVRVRAELVDHPGPRGSTPTGGTTCSRPACVWNSSAPARRPLRRARRPAFPAPAPATGTSAPRPRPSSAVSTAATW